ncbi:MAG: hypothetical protein AB2792_22240 [Candidatus Thiodiazotropha sp.]
MSKAKKVKLSKIILDTKDGKQVELTLEEAKELHDQLHTLFGEKTTFIPSTPIVIERDRWNPLRPYWYDTVTYTAAEPKHGGLDVACSVQGDSGLTVSYYGKDAA